MSVPDEIRDAPAERPSLRARERILDSLSPSSPAPQSPSGEIPLMPLLVSSPATSFFGARNFLFSRRDVRAVQMRHFTVPDLTTEGDEYRMSFQMGWIMQ